MAIWVCLWEIDMWEHNCNLEDINVRSVAY